MNKFLWYWYRIKKIPLIEYHYRIGQYLKKYSDKFFINEKDKKFSSPTIDIFNSIDINEFEKIFPNLKEKVISQAEKIILHNFEIFGIEKKFGDSINWHLDPKTNKSWPIDFWGNIKYRDSGNIGGIKFAWELNRLHHFPKLAIAYALTNENKYKDEIFNQLDDWLKSNPYPKGINWIMGIELGIRIINIVYTLKFLNEKKLAPGHESLLAKFISIHGNHLYRFPSKYSSCANHSIAEALGLFAIGLCFPGLDNASKWKRFGKEVLEREVIRQIYQDGSSFEHSLPYLQFVLDHYLIFCLLCREYKEPYSTNVEKRLKSSFQFISQIIDKNGNYPLIGDDDDGYLLKLWFGKHNNFMSILNIGAVLFNRSELILQNAEYDHKTFFLLGLDSWKKWTEQKNCKMEGSLRTRYFQDAGLAVIEDKKPYEILFIGNSGPLGLKSLGAHGHADALSFWLSIDGNPIFIDPGTYLYHSGGKWRNYFRSTSAHNTIKIDGRDQAEILADFIFGTFYKVKNTLFYENEEKAVWSASHDGYKRLKQPIIHQREVIYFKNEKKFNIVDYIDCKASHLVESFFHFHPDCEIFNRNKYYLIKCKKAEIRFNIDEKWSERNLIKGGLNPIFGWYSPRFNYIQDTHTLELKKNVNGKNIFVNTIYLT